MFTTENGIGVVVMVVFAVFWLAFMLWEDWGQAGKTARARASAKANGWAQAANLHPLRQTPRAMTESLPRSAVRRVRILSASLVSVSRRTTPFVTMYGDNAINSPPMYGGPASERKSASGRPGAVKQIGQRISGI